MPEWLGDRLQNGIHRFESGSRPQFKPVMKIAKYAIFAYGATVARLILVQKIVVRIHVGKLLYVSS